MSFFSAPTATSTNNSTATQQTNFAPWTQAFNQNVAGAAWNMLAPSLQVPTAGQVAGFNPDQTMGFDLTRNMALNQFAQNPQMQQAMAGAMQGAGPQRAAMMPAAQASAQAAMGNMNPFLQNVVDSTMRNMTREKNRNSAEIGARAAAGGSFGGSREAVQRANLDRNFRDEASSMVSNLMAQGYDRATAMEMSNAQMRQQANAANAGALNNMTQFNAQNAMALPALLDRLQTSDQARQMNALQSLLGVGNQQQAFAQTALDTPLRSLEMLLGIAPNVYDQTQTVNASSSGEAPTGAPSIGQQAIGFGLSQLPKLFG